VTKSKEKKQNQTRQGEIRTENLKHRRRSA